MRLFIEDAAERQEACDLLEAHGISVDLDAGDRIIVEGDAMQTASEHLDRAGISYVQI